MCQCRRGRFDLWVRKIPWRRKWQPTPVFLPGKSPCPEDPGGLQSMMSRVGHDRATEHRHTHTQTHIIIYREKYISLYSAFFPLVLRKQNVNTTVSDASRVHSKSLEPRTYFSLVTELERAPSCVLSVS